MQGASTCYSHATCSPGGWWKTVKAHYMLWHLGMDWNTTSSSGEWDSHSSGSENAALLATEQLTASMESTLSTALNGLLTGLNFHLSQLRTAAEL